MIYVRRLRNTFGIADNDVDEKKYGISHSADDANEDNPFAGTFQTQQFDLDTGGNHMNRKDRKKMFSRSVNALHDISDPEKLNRTGFATMPIHTLTHDKLNAALLETKVSMCRSKLYIYLPVNFS